MAGAKAVTSVAEVIVAQGRTIKGVDNKLYGAGETVRVPSSEVQALVDQGFLVDGDAVEKKIIGPHVVSQGSGPAVRIA